MAFSRPIQINFEGTTRRRVLQENGAKEVEAYTEEEKKKLAKAIQIEFKTQHEGEKVESSEVLDFSLLKATKREIDFLFTHSNPIAVS